MTKWCKWCTLEAMKNILNLAYNCILDNKLINKGQTIGVATSGGSDSIALLHFLHSIQSLLHFNLVAIHVNHNLRENSADDEHFVISFCKKENIKCLTYNVDVKNIIKTQHLNLEDAARQARYEIFKQCKEQNIVDKIALAHHQSDQVETVLMHLFRGSGLRGMSGMSLVRDFYIRPFLTTPKINIMQYIESNNLNYVNDQTNDDIDYSRNYIRKVLLPQIENKFNGAKQNICNFATLCEEILSDTHAIAHSFPYTIKDNKVIIPIKNFKSLNSFAQFEVINFALNKLDVYKNFESKHFKMINKLLSSQSGKKINLNCNIICLKQYDNLIFYKQENVAKNNKADKSIKQTNIALFSTPLKLGKLNINGCDIAFINKLDKAEISEHTHVLDFDKLPKNCVIRFKQEHDFIQKFGSGHKSLKRYLSDLKVPADERKRTIVIACGNEIFCVLGVNISDKVKVDNNTKHFLTIDKI